MAVFILRRVATILVSLVMLAASLGGAGFAGQIAAPSSELDRARAAMRDGHADEAIAHLKSWLTSHPKDATAMAMLGDAYLAADQPEQAEAELKDALKISPGNFAALMELGGYYGQSGHLDQAEPLLERAVRENPHSAVARLEWATVLSRLHEYPKAAAALRSVPAPTAANEQIAFERLKASIDLGLGNASAAAADMELALKESREDAGLQFATGVAESQAGHWTRAIELLGPIFQNNQDPRAGLALLEAQVGAHQDFSSTLAALRAAALPSDQELALRMNLAQILTSHDLYAEAATDFERAVALEPGHADLLYDLALAQYRAGRLDAALKSALNAKTAEDSALIESLLGEIQEKNGDSLGAAHSFQAAVALAPNQEEYRVALGLELMSHGTFEAALTVFQQGVELFPHSFPMRVALGIAHYSLQQYPSAISALLAAATLGKDPSIAYEFLGNIQLQQVIPLDPEAVKQLCGYADAHPKNGKVQAYCGAMLARAGHDRGDAAPPADALRRLRDAARLAPEDSTARCEFGKALDGARQWSQARQELEACVRLDPNTIDAHYVLANVYRRLGENDLAMKEVKLHEEAEQRMVEANALRDRTIKKFLVTMQPPSSP
jgi:tetratricopeptide (TPR) repeat protein